MGLRKKFKYTRGEWSEVGGNSIKQGPNFFVNCPISVSVLIKSGFRCRCHEKSTIERKLVQRHSTLLNHVYGREDESLDRVGDNSGKKGEGIHKERESGREKVTSRATDRKKGRGRENPNGQWETRSERGKWKTQRDAKTKNTESLPKGASPESKKANFKEIQ